MLVYCVLRENKKIWFFCWVFCIIEIKKKKFVGVWVLLVDWSEIIVYICEFYVKKWMKCKIRLGFSRIFENFSSMFRVLLEEEGRGYIGLL